MAEAAVYLNSNRIGILQAGRGGRLRFRYTANTIERACNSDRAIHALSVTMPIPLEDADDDGWFDDRACAPFFEGLLPDHPMVRRRLAAALQDGRINPDNPFDMLTALAGDCAGAVSIMPMDTADPLPDPTEPQYFSLTDVDLAERVANLHERPLFIDGGEFRFSLAGVQDKAAILKVGNGWALPLAGTPSSHILKVDIPGLPGSICVESFCLSLARDSGLPAPRATIIPIGGKPVMMIARYDRRLIQTGDQQRLVRTHQEDFCQATGTYPEEKYESKGGPGWRQVFELLDHSSRGLEDRVDMLDRVIFQYLIGNPDAHAKNYSFVWKGQLPRLAPLYDLNCADAYRSFYKRQLPRMAMAIGGEFDPDALSADHWRTFAKDVRLSSELVLDRLRELADEIPDRAADVAGRLRGTAAFSPLIDIAVDAIADRASRAIDIIRNRGRQPEP